MEIIKRFLLLLLVVANYHVAAQNTFLNNVNESSIPKVVALSFNWQYPNILEHSWHATHISYWYNDFGDGWYNDWYGSRTEATYSYQQANYYEVIFTKNPGEVSRAIYNQYGYWYETRTLLKALPPMIVELLNKTKYATWKCSINKERIEATGWPETVYRFKVTKGIQSFIIRLDSKGSLTQERKIEYKK